MIIKVDFENTYNLIISIFLIYITRILKFSEK